MVRRIWIGCGSIWLLASGGCAALGFGNDDPRSQNGAAEVCSQERGALERTKKRYKTRHPSVVEQALRVEAACQPAPNAACAIARVDVATANARYGKRHRATSAARRAEGKACSDGAMASE
jgi:hypothetical protein